jgi:hypothetical protein
MRKLRRLAATSILVAGLLTFAVCRGGSELDEGKAMTVSETEHKFTNHLIEENSPYLLSHAHNPVNWYPWGEEALARARREDKPIFLSIGYAACHWCHVMERESFENETIAAYLNAHYICIKVDREQRPDLDDIYMTFTQAMTGAGGWPMSVFLTPDLKPFFAGTYFPPDDRYGRPGFAKVITEIAEAYRDERESIVQSAERITAGLTEQLTRRSGPALLTADLVKRGAEELMRGFDPVNGGFGGAPKFPHATELALFLRYYRNSGDLSFLNAAEKSLKGMAEGGIYDHLGGGFARYSTDARWLVPHFEKMLYDNGLLVADYIDAYQISGDEYYLGVVRGTLSFILREMTDKTGGFYSALDADSEGEEGKFYVWSRAEIDSILGDESKLFCDYYNVTEGGNFEGHNILNLTAASHRVKDNSGRDDFDELMAAARKKLFEARSKRVRPLTDDKILTSWNGLALGALARGYQVTGDERYLKAAVKNADFVRSELFRDGKLTHSYREGGHSNGQFLEDYGYYLYGLLELYQVDCSNDNGRWLGFAVQLADNAIALFRDEDGRLYMREAEQADLLYRPTDENDNARPSPGSYLITALFKLSRLTEKPEYGAAAEKALRAVSGSIVAQPGGMASALLALDYYLKDKIEIVIVGDGTGRDGMLELIRGKYLPNALVAISDKGDTGWPLFENRTADKGETLAFVCRNSACRLPVATAAALGAELGALLK